jgi:hypothetical protein
MVFAFTSARSRDARNATPGGTALTSSIVVDTATPKFSTWTARPIPVHRDSFASTGRASIPVEPIALTGSDACQIEEALPGGTRCGEEILTQDRLFLR